MKSNQINGKIVFPFQILIIKHLVILAEEMMYVNHNHLHTSAINIAMIQEEYPYLINNLFLASFAEQVKILQRTNRENRLSYNGIP